jgi:hypothetical protein
MVKKLNGVDFIMMKKLELDGVLRRKIKSFIIITIVKKLV